ncbi:MAG TPA: hypothetical protein VHZ06_05190 [Marmoricola sp.]|jgi:hypothetical protein|nr:hypothetical protein [Marmoricola sp.]
MLTDEELTGELGAAFRAGTHDLTYQGRRRPRRTAVVAVPAAAVGLALTAVAITAAVNAGSGSTPTGTVAGASAAPSSVAPAVRPRLVTEKISLAGYTLHYTAKAGSPAPVYATTEPGPVPDGFTPVSATNGAKAWIGKDPATGDNALFVQISDRNGGNLFALHSAVWTQQQLVDMFHNGTPATVPMVKQ